MDSAIFTLDKDNNFKTVLKKGLFIAEKSFKVLEYEIRVYHDSFKCLTFKIGVEGKDDVEFIGLLREGFKILKKIPFNMEGSNGDFSSCGEVDSIAGSHVGLLNLFMDRWPHHLIDELRNRECKECGQLKRSK